MSFHDKIKAAFLHFQQCGVHEANLILRDLTIIEDAQKRSVADVAGLIDVGFERKESAFRTVEEVYDIMVFTNFFPMCKTGVHRYMFFKKEVCEAFAKGNVMYVYKIGDLMARLNARK